MIQCDICGDKVEAVVLIQLLDIYQTDKIEDCCPACEKIINKRLFEIKSIQSKMTQGLFKRFLTVLRGKNVDNTRLFEEES